MVGDVGQRHSVRVRQDSNIIRAEWCPGIYIFSLLAPPPSRSANCQAHCYVTEPKRALIQDTTGPMQCRLSHFLFRQHATVNTGRGVAPSKAMLGRKVSSPLHATLLAAALLELSREMMPGSPLVYVWGH